MQLSVTFCSVNTVTEVKSRPAKLAQTGKAQLTEMTNMQH